MHLFVAHEDVLLARRDDVFFLDAQLAASGMRAARVELVRDLASDHDLRPMPFYRFGGVQCVDVIAIRHRGLPAR